MPAALASLPMYDWPEVRSSTDALWQGICTELDRLGIDAPEMLFRISDHADTGSSVPHWEGPPNVLDRPKNLDALWRSPHLLLGQTCGLPYVTQLRDDVAVLGSFDFDFPRAFRIKPGSGEYCSVLVVRRDDETATSVTSLRGRTVGFNEVGSQSGNAALRHLIAPLTENGAFFGSAMPSGSHRESLRLVAQGKADVAALDAASWLLALDHEPGATDLRVLAVTPPTPGLPLITNAQNLRKVTQLRTALANAIEQLEPQHRTTLHLQGFQPLTDSDYELIADRLKECADLGYTELL